VDRQVVNPWTWQDQFGFVQGNLVQSAQRVLLCAGQLSADADGNLVHAGEMGAQLTQALANLETVLTQAGMSLENVVRLNYYTTDVDGFIAAIGPLASRLSATGCRPASTLLGVSRLAFAGQLVELEATAIA
jgi:enamine deaminase RidA (YjgF/YER057c/UK114 family)